MGTPPNMGETRFMMPWETHMVRSVTGRSGKRSLFSWVMATTALPSVSGICGRVKSRVPVTMSSHLIWCSPNWGRRKPMFTWASSVRSDGLAMIAATMPSRSRTNMAGIFGLVKSTNVSPRAMVDSTGDPTIR